MDAILGQIQTAAQQITAAMTSAMAMKIVQAVHLIAADAMIMTMDAILGQIQTAAQQITAAMTSAMAMKTS